MEIKLLPFDSELWEEYRGAYGNVCEEVKILMGDIKDIPTQYKLRRLDFDEKNDYQIAFDNLCENLWHQMTFYEATYIVIPYMLRLLEEKEKQDDFDWRVSIISLIGVCLATDININDNTREFSKYEVNKDIKENYDESIKIIKDKTKNFVNNYIDKIKSLDYNTKIEFSISVLSILSDRELAFILIMNGFEYFPISCDKCDYYDEECEFSDDSFIDKITPAVNMPWNGTDYDNIYIWFSNLLRNLEAEEESNIISYLYGDFTCPECGEKKPLIDFIKHYYK